MASQSLSTLAISIASSCSWNVKCRKCYSPSLPLNSKPDGLIYSSIANQLSLRLMNPRPLLQKNLCSTSSTLSSSLPTENLETVSTEKVDPNWSERALRSIAIAEVETHKQRYKDTGTECILMGMLIEGTSPASKFLRSNGITLTKVREEANHVLGKVPEWKFSPDFPVLSERAKKALARAVDEKLKSGDSGETTSTHLLLSIWADKECGGHRILAKLGFNDEKAAELVKSLSKQS